MARCIACDSPATVALHATSKEEHKPPPHEGTFHYTELVFACDTHVAQPDVLKAALPDPERFEWAVQADAAPITACPQCGTATHGDRIWTCSPCTRSGCGACMPQHLDSGLCGRCFAQTEGAG